MDAENSTCATPACGSCGPWWKLPLLLALVLIAIFLLRGRNVREVASDSGETPARSASAAEGTVSLAIDFGDGRRTEFAPIGWRDGMTVRDLTRETPRPARRLEVQGIGKSAFLKSLDGVENEGADARNWMYTVNGERGDRSFAIYELKPGDQVLWTFTAQR